MHNASSSYRGNSIFAMHSIWRSSYLYNMILHRCTLKTMQDSYCAKSQNFMTAFKCTQTILQVSWLCAKNCCKRLSGTLFCLEAGGIIDLQMYKNTVPKRWSLTCIYIFKTCEKCINIHIQAYYVSICASKT